jgi:hypothetical protein
VLFRRPHYGRLWVNSTQKPELYHTMYYKVKYFLKYRKEIAPARSFGSNRTRKNRQPHCSARFDLSLPNEPKSCRYRIQTARQANTIAWPPTSFACPALVILALSSPTSLAIGARGGGKVKRPGTSLRHCQILPFRNLARFLEFPFSDLRR